jgi:hypothetical protein
VWYYTNEEGDIMFRNMIRSREERQRDFEEFQKRMCPFGDEQLNLLREAVSRITLVDSDDPMLFYYYLTSADNYRLERDGDLVETYRYLNKAKPKLSETTMGLLIALMELNLKLESLEDFPSDRQIREFYENEM